MTGKLLIYSIIITLFIIITKKENQNVNIDCKKEECLTVNINNKEKRLDQDGRQ